MKQYLIVAWILLLFIFPNTGVGQQCYQRVVKSISHSPLNEEVEKELKYQKAQLADEFMYFTDSWAYGHGYILLISGTILSNISEEKIYKKTNPDENGGLPFKDIKFANKVGKRILFHLTLVIDG